MELCEKLKQIRKENNLTQQQLADELCLSRTVITKYERGHKVPNLDTLLLISNYFKTSIFDEYKSKLKLFFLLIRCCIPYLISLILLFVSSLSLVCNLINVNNQYGYNIYNDELKVKNSDEILIVKYNHINDIKIKSVKYIIIQDLNYNDNKNLYNLNVNYKSENKIDGYVLIFINEMKSENNLYYEDGYYNRDIKIKHKPFIYPLKDYDESLPYNEQTGECSKILNYYIDLIEKVK